jgi:hypothetical protein
VSENQKNIALEDLHDCNETLYHRVFVDYLDEMGPVDLMAGVHPVCELAIVGIFILC